MKTIRLWKLGNLEHKISPTQEAVNSLRKILDDLDYNTSGIAEIIWGPDIEVQCINTYDITDDYVITEINESGNEKTIKLRRLDSES